jgi:hypothetical protein
MSKCKLLPDFSVNMDNGCFISQEYVLHKEWFVNILLQGWPETSGAWMMQGTMLLFYMLSSIDSGLDDFCLCSMLL